MRAARLLLAMLVLAGVQGCEKERGGAGPTNPSPNAPGVGEQPSTAVSAENLAKQPTVGPAPDGGALDADHAPGPGDENIDRRGTTRTPDAVLEGAPSGATSAPSRDTSPTGTREGSGPGDRMDADAKAVFQAAPGIELTGEAELEQEGDGVEIEVEVKNAPPGLKGIHIHQKPDCTDIPGKSMGDHFAPAAKQHGLPDSGKPRHLGDLGNIRIDEDGEGELEITVAKANLKHGDPMSLLGRALVIHEKQDEGSQPSGNSGKPIACAVIKPE